MTFERVMRLLSSDGFKVSVAQMFQRGTSFFIFLLLSKLMTSLEYADFVIVFTLMFVISEIGNSGFLQGVTRYVSDKRNNKNLFNDVVFTGFLNILAIQVVILALVFILYSFGVFEESVNAEIFYILIFVLLTLIMSMYNAIFNGGGKYKHYFRSFFLNSILLLLLISMAAYNDCLSIKNILSIYICSLFITILYQSLVMKDSFKFVYRKEVTKSIWSFGKWYSLWAVLSVIESKFEVFFMTYLSMKNELVYFDVAIKFIVFVQISMTILATLYNPEIVATKDINELKRLKGKIKKIIICLCMWNFLSSIIISVFINVYYGGHYNKSIYCYAIVSIGLYFSILSYPYSAEIYRRNKSKLLFYIAVLGAVAKFILALILIPYYGAIGASINFSIVCFLVFIFSFYLVKRVA